MFIISKGFCNINFNPDNFIVNSDNKIMILDRFKL